MLENHHHSIFKTYLQHHQLSIAVDSCCNVRRSTGMAWTLRVGVILAISEVTVAGAGLLVLKQQPERLRLCRHGDHGV